MKTRTTILSAISLLAITAISCSKEENVTRPASFESFRLNAVSEATDKTHLDGAYVIWDKGDDLSAFSINATTHTNNKLSCISYGTDDAAFSGEIESGTTSFYAIYPYGELTYNNEVVSGASIPATQTATNGSFANGVSLAVASGTKTPGNPDCGELSFKNLCSILSFTLPENITFANRIVVTSKSGAGMAGAVSINCAKQTISGASSSSVTLDGTFAGGGTYYIAVAPGTYTNGFSFTISTKGGNSYARETTKTIPAEAGKIYPLGTLSLALGQDAFETSMYITHNVSEGVLTGSTARFSSSVKSEFASLVKNVSTTVTLKNGSSTVCRSKTAVSGTSVSNEELDMENGFYYLPNGVYTYTAEVSYTVNNGTKDIQRTLTYNGSATSPKPDSFAIDAILSGYTSYSDYKGTDGRSASVANANNCDGSTIYAIGATYKSGLSTDVHNQCSGLLSISSTLDGNAASGNKGGQSWTAHTIGATWSFDGASGTCAATKAVYVTGLPYKASSFSKKDDDTATDNVGKNWKRKSWNNKVDGKALRCGGTSGSGEAAWRSDFHFCSPASINVTLSCPDTSIYTYKFIKAIGTTFKGSINGAEVFSQDGPSKGDTTQTYSPSGNGTISSNADQILLTSTYKAAGPFVNVNNVQLLYR